MKRVLLTIATALGVLLALEGAARWFETDPGDRTIPTPAPVRDENRSVVDAFSKRQQDARTQAGLATPLVEDESRGWALPPSQVLVEGKVRCRINSLGMRGPEPTSKTEKEIRLLALGDSSVFGSGVREKDVFVVQAALSLSQALGKEVTWANGAVPGHDSGQSLATLKLHGARLAPDWVVVGSLWSDVYANFGPPPGEEAIHRIRSPLRQLALYRTARRLLAPWLRTRKVKWIDTQDDVGADPRGSSSRVSLPQYMVNLRDIIEATRNLGARPVLIALPAPMDFDTVAVPETVLEYREAMRLVAQEQGALFVDGPAAFRQANAGIAWFLDQVHPNPHGHKILGQALAKVMEAGP